MCTLVLLFRPQHEWPVLIANNRDEMLQRPWLPPARHWPDQPGVIAGLDQLGGGSWFGVNDTGVVVGVMNRVGSLGPAPGLRSRGELVLKALAFTEATAAAEALCRLDPALYRSFNLVVADVNHAYWLRHSGNPEAVREFELEGLPPGLSMFTAHERNDLSSTRIRSYLPRFEAATIPRPADDDWSAWRALLASTEHAPGSAPLDAMTVVTASGFGTVSSTLLALPASPQGSVIWRFAAGRPDQVPYHRVDTGI